MLELCTYPNPVLRLQAEEITEITDEIRALATEMMEKMYKWDGVGLAAPQVGVSKRLVVMDTGVDGDSNPMHLINPVITRKSKDKETAQEGCLSLPGINAKIKRPAAVTVEALDLEGNKVSFEAEGLLARCAQHEIDHLDGVLFTDRASLASKLSLRGELAALEEKQQDAS